MKRLKKLSAFLLTLMLCVGVVSMPVEAADSTITQDGLEITLTTDKEEYSDGEEIKLTLTVKNTNTEAVTDIELASFISDGYELTEESIQALKELVKLGAGAEESVPITVVKKDSGSTGGGNNNTVTTILKSPNTADNNNIALWVTVFFAGVALIGGAYAIKNKKAKQALSVMLCVAMAASTFVTTSAPVSAMVQDKTVTLEKTVKYAGENVTFRANFSYKFEDGYELVWADEFDGTKLNRDDWNVELHAPGWVNKELQSYVDSPDNIAVKDGKLIITPIKTVDENGNVSYTSGRINTQDKHIFKYGKFEARVKVPTGAGYLPAFWLMANNENLYGQWPRCGEIDIMEVKGHEPNTAYGTIHYGNPHSESQSTYTLSEGTFADEFHTFTCEWEPGEIKWYVDGILFHTENDWYSAVEGGGELTYPAPFDQPFYIILNLAVGGSWVGNPNESTSFENQTYEVDYVRVYQKDSYDENVTKPEKEEVVLRNPDANGNYIVNGDFAVAEDLTDDVDWKFLLADGGAATAAITNEEMVINSTAAGNVDYSVQLVQANLPMKEGATYTLTFDAYADEARTMIVDVSAPDRSFTRYLKDTKVQLTTETQSFSYDFTMTSSDDANGRLEFNLGAQGSTAGVHIDNVKLVQKSYTDLSNVKTVLADGNYVYNGKFEEGAGRMEYWDITNNAGAQVSVTNTDNIRKLMIVAPEGTSAEKPVIISQSGLAMTNDGKYVFSAEVQGDAGKTINVTYAGNNMTHSLDGTVETISAQFTQAAGNDKNVVFTITQPGTYYIDNVRIDEDKLIKNGSFNAGFVGFEPFVDSGISADVSYVVDSQTEDNAADFTIDNTGKEDWHIQLKQNNVVLEQGQWYRLSLDMKSSIARDVSVAIQRNGAVHTDANGKEDWTPYLQKTETLGTAYKTFTYEFQMKEATDIGSIFNVTMGAVGGKQITEQHRICIDNIVLEKIPEPEINVETGSNMLKNARFESGELKPWEDSSWGGTHETTVKDNSVIYKITDVGTEDSHIQLKQGDLPLDSGETYKVTFKATSTETRTIKTGVMSAGYVGYGGTDVELKKDTPTDVSFEFTMSTDDSTGVMYVSMGKIAGKDNPASTITLSDFTLEKLDKAPEVIVDPMPVGVNLLKNVSFENGEWDPWVDSSHKGSHTTDVKDSSVVYTITDFGEDDNSTDSHIQLKQMGIVLEKGKSYTVSFIATSTEARTIKSDVMSPTYAWYGGTTKDLKAGETTNVTYTFTMNETLKDGGLFISMGKIGANTPLSTITLSDFSLIKLADDAGAGDTGSGDTGSGDSGTAGDGTTGEDTFDGGLITNGDFSDGGNGWAMHIQSDVEADPANGVEAVDGAAGEYNIVDGKAVFTITDVGTKDWHVHLQQPDLSMEVGATYQVRFKIKSDVNRTVKYVLQNPDNYQLSYTGNDKNIISLNANEDTVIDYEMTLVATDENPLVNSDKIQFQISMGNVGENPQPGTITIDDVSIVKVSGPSDTEGDGNLLTNGDFSDGDNDWETNIHTKEPKGPVGEVSVSGSDAAIVYVLDQVGSENWHVQLKQTGLKFEKGVKYTVKLDISSTAARKVECGFYDSTNETLYLGAFKIDLKANDPITYSGEITPLYDGDTFTISLGKMSEWNGTENVPIDTAPSTITIDNISIVKK